MKHRFIPVLVVTVGLWSRNVFDIRVLLTFLSPCYTEHRVLLTTLKDIRPLVGRSTSRGVGSSIMMSDVFFVFVLESFQRPVVSVAEFHVEVLKVLSVNTLVSRSHSRLPLDKGSFVETLLKCFLNMFQAV